MAFFRKVLGFEVLRRYLKNRRRARRGLWPARYRRRGLLRRYLG